MSDILDRITMLDFPDTQYVKEETKKDTIYIHHTESSSNPFAVLDYWKSNAERVATHFMIAGPPPAGETRWKDGQIFQCFSTKYWAWHLGGEQMIYPKGRTGAAASVLNSKSIGIELLNWGPIGQKNGRFITQQGDVISPEKVMPLSWRGFNYYQPYSDAQLASLKDLLLFLCNKWSIPKEYKGDGMFNVSTRALTGQPGIWTHASVRADKYDCSPQPKLLTLLALL